MCYQGALVAPAANAVVAPADFCDDQNAAQTQRSSLSLQNISLRALVLGSDSRTEATWSSGYALRCL
jgi:hypothetical protein